jgi:hypothetical protein
VAGDAADRFWVECGARRYVGPLGPDRLDPDGVDGALLPARLAAACACALDADGAGLSVHDRGFRVPLGASDDTASYAERLQFTQGQGPCLDAGREAQIVVARSGDIRSGWPQFADALFAGTPYRAVVTVPLSMMSTTRGALDLFFVEEDGMSGLLLADVAQICAVVVEALRRADDHGQPTAQPEDEADPQPSWLTGPISNRRHFVWLAVGMAMATFDVGSEDALALLRAYSYGHGQLLDDVAGALIEGRLPLDQINN